MAEKTADSAYKNATKISVFFLPIRSLNLPENNIANIAANEGALTTQPDCISFKLNSGPAKDMTPEMIPASKPKRNPPNATIKLIKMVYNLFFMIPFEFLK
tara:strand:- start:699 stop:1001 length:303 start_codon:yes stop_codon:yes gene_type:complete